MAPKPKLGRKLLVATVGLATVSYVACGGKVDEQEKKDTGSEIDSGVSSGNLVPPDTGEDTGPPPFDAISGNLVPPDTGELEDTSTAEDTAPPFDVSSGNLVPPDTGM